MSDIVLYGLDEGVAQVRLNRPERLNAITPMVCAALSAALDRAVEEGARALLLTGEGRGFCSGADLLDQPVDTFVRNIATWFDTAYTPLFIKLAELPIPIVTAVNGPAAGAGCSIALSGDFVVAARSAYFVQSFASLGLVPDGGATWLLPRLVGLQRANLMMMLGERIEAPRALEWGMIHDCVEDEALVESAAVLAQRLARGATKALGMIRRSVRGAQTLDFREALDREAHDQIAAFHSADGREGLSAFVDGRTPRFSGK